MKISLLYMKRIKNVEIEEESTCQKKLQLDICNTDVQDCWTTIGTTSIYDQIMLLLYNNFLETYPDFLPSLIESVYSSHISCERVSLERVSLLST